MRPDLTVVRGKADSVHHLLVEVKCVCPFSTVAHSTGVEGAYAAFANTAAELKRGIHAKYKCKEDAWVNEKGHEVQPAIFEVFGGFDEGAVKLLNRWAGKARGKTPPGEEPPWAARNYVPYWSQRISRAIQVGAAQQVEDAVLRLGGSELGAALPRGRAGDGAAAGAA